MTVMVSLRPIAAFSGRILCGLPAARGARGGRGRGRSWEVEVEVPARPTADEKAVNKYQCSGAVRQRQHRSRRELESAGASRDEAASQTASLLGTPKISGGYPAAAAAQVQAK